MPKRIISSFTDGMDTLTDERRLSPNTEKERTGGSPLAENVSITKAGALVTSPGYEVVSSAPSGSGAVQNILDYDKDDDNRFLLITHGTKHYSITKSNTVWDDTNLGSYGATEATDVGGVIYKSATLFSSGTITITSYGNLVDGSNQDQMKVLSSSLFKAQTGAVTEGERTFQAASSNDATANSLTKQINSSAGINQSLKATVSGAVITIEAINPGVRRYALEYVNNTGAVGATVSGAALTPAAEERVAILGAHESTNSNLVQNANITNAMANALDSSVAGAYIFAVFMERLFIAKGNNIIYSKINDAANIDGSVGFNDIVTGLHVEGPRLTVFTRSYNQGVIFTYDDNNLLTLPRQDPYERQYGNLAFKALHLKDANAVYWAKEGFATLGAEASFDELGIPRSITLSNQIDPTLKGVNYDQASKACSIYDGENKESYWSVPFNGSSYNNRTFVYNWNWNAWTMRTGISPTTYAKFQTGTDTRDKVFLTDHFNPRILKFNTDYSYDGSGYLRRWKSKKFTMGADLNMKNYNYLTLVGSIYTGTEFTIRITQDNKVKEFTVDKNSLVKDAFGGYLGDNWIGDEWLGGDVAPESAFFRFKTKIKFPPEIKKGFEMQFEIFNSGAEQPWKIDNVEIDFEYLPAKRVPAKYINAGLKPKP